MKKTIKCVICGNEKSDYLDTILWYDNRSYFDVYWCNICFCHHMDMKQIDKSIYDKIYKNPELVGGYDRYFRYFNEVESHKNALKRLSETDHVYWIVYDYLKDKQWLKCLEIWCGMWYLTYAINQSWNMCVWYDLSSEVIYKAQKKFWHENYFIGDVFETLKDSDEKFDVIIATELIEHIDDYDSFFSNCKKLSKENGVILITTPNKDFYHNDAIWIWDLPPVHTTWWSENTFKLMWKKYWFQTSFYPIIKYHTDQNYLFLKLYFNFIVGKISQPHFGTIKPSINKSKSFINYIVNLERVKIISNFLIKNIYGETKSWITLWCIYINKNV